MRRVTCAQWRLFLLVLIFLGTLSCSRQPARQSASASTSPETCQVTINWDKISCVSKSTPTLQVVVNPPLRRGSPIHDRVFQALYSLGADYVRYVPWLPYPKLAVAELEPPANGKTSWDFSLMDCYMALDVPYAIQLAKAVAPYKVLWMEEPVPPDQVDDYRRIKDAVPDMLMTGGEHEFTRYGFRDLIEKKPWTFFSRIFIVPAGFPN